MQRLLVMLRHLIWPPLGYCSTRESRMGWGGERERENVLPMLTTACGWEESMCSS